MKAYKIFYYLATFLNKLIKMKKIITYTFTLFLIISLFNCTDKDEVPTDLEVQNFIWKGLNLYYFWLDEKPDLQDDRFTTQNQLNSFIEGKEPFDLFNSLLNDPENTDKWSWIVDNYIALEELFAGTTKNNGMEFGLVGFSETSEEVFGYVRYIIPNSDASGKDIHRGDIIYGINGSPLTRSNYKQLLFETDSYTVNFGTFQIVNDAIEVTPNNISISLTKAELTENPVHTVMTHDIGGHKIGYIFYNQFVRGFEEELNDAFLQLTNENVTDLVLDLRYNGGGAVSTAVNLASMITGQFDNQLFASKQFNHKIQLLLTGEADGVIEDNFQTNINNGQAINSLNLNKIYVLVTGNSASASELIINGLKPYIDVELIGTKTHGKYVGSVTLYDSDSYGKDDSTLNPNHFYAMQPIVLEIVNKLGENDKDGFEPDINLPENYADLGVIGDVDEPLLAAAINAIIGTRSPVKNVKQLPVISNSKANNFAQNNMYVDFSLN